MRGVAWCGVVWRTIGRVTGTNTCCEASESSMTPSRALEAPRAPMAAAACDAACDEVGLTLLSTDQSAGGSSSVSLKSSN